MSNVLTKTIFGEQLNESMSLHDAIELLISQNLINVGQLAEMAISKKANVAMCSPCTPNIDLVSGVQIKYATVMKSASSDYYKAYISRNTTAPMCVVISNPMENNKQYFLYIPYKAHRHLSGNCINVSFGSDGRSGSSQWWNYQIDSFDDLCKLAK